MRFLVLLFTLLYTNFGKCLELNSFYKYLVNESESSSNCEVQKQALFNGLLKQELWALKSKLVIVEINSCSAIVTVKSLHVGFFLQVGIL